MTCTINDLADFIEKHRWIQGKYDDGKDGYCMVGAMYQLCGLEYLSLHVKVHSKLRERYPTMAGYVTQWNDEPGRTKKEVIEFLRS